MEPARESDPRSAAHDELEAILREADAARRRAGDDGAEVSEEMFEPRPKLGLAPSRGETAPARPASARPAPARPAPARPSVRFETYDVRVDDPGEMRFRTFRLSGRFIVCLALGLSAGLMWATFPNGIWFLRTQPLPGSYTEASVRWAMVLTAQRIDRFASEHSRLPQNLLELGPAPSDLVTYEPLAGNEYRLQAPGQNSPLTLRSDSDRELFLGNATDILRLGPDRAP